MGEWNTEADAEMRLSSRLLNFDRRTRMSAELGFSLMAQAQTLERSLNNSAMMRYNGETVRLFAGDDGVKVYLNGELKLTLPISERSPEGA